MIDDDSGLSHELNQFFEQYRSACPDVEPGVQFMPVLWQKIEARRSNNLWFSFTRLGKNALTVSAALCLLLLAMNLSAPPEVSSTYTDALISAGSAEQVAFSEALPPLASDHDKNSPE